MSTVLTSACHYNGMHALLVSPEAELHARGLEHMQVKTYC
jgi:hypothetical protein